MLTDVANYLSYCGARTIWVPPVLHSISISIYVEYGNNSHGALAAQKHAYRS
jgi:hypothetical protein